MKGINCNIIRDLLPSYVDNVCSEDSRYLVEEHINSCAQCRTQLELLKSTELTDEQGEQTRVLYFKKIKRYYEKGIICLVFLTLALIGGFLFMVNHYGMARSSVFYIIFAMLLIAAYVLMPDSPVLNQHPKQSGVFVFVSILASAFVLSYYHYAIYYYTQNTPADMTENGPFGVPLNEVGPYLQRRLVLMAVLQLGIFILSNIRLLQGYQIHKSIYGFTLTGFWLTAGYICILHNMTTVEELYPYLTRMTVGLIAEGIVGSLISCSLAKKVLK